MLWTRNRQRLQCEYKYIKKRFRNIKRRKNKLKKISGQGLPEELGKYIWLTKAYTSQEAPTSTSGSSSPSMEEVRKENEKRQRILELKDAIKKAEAEWNTSDVEKLKKELRGLTNEGFLTKVFKCDGRY